MSSDGAAISVLSSEFDPTGLSIAIIASRFNTDITDRLVAGAVDCFTSHGLNPESLEIIRVPGAWELPQATSVVLRLARYDAIVTLGCVIRGETPHFEIISKATINAIMDLSVKFNKPIGNGIIACLNKKQASERSFSKKRNKIHRIMK